MAVISNIMISLLIASTYKISPNKQTQAQQHKPVRRAGIRIRHRAACHPPEPSSTSRLYRAAPDTLPPGI